MRSRPGDPDRHKKCTGLVGCRVTAMSTTVRSSTDPDHDPRAAARRETVADMSRTFGPTVPRCPAASRSAASPRATGATGPSAVPRWPALLTALLLVLPLSSAARAAEPVPGGGRVWPLAGRPLVVRAWEPPASTYGPGHRGVDLAAEPGDPVRAAASGRVSFAGRVAGRGVVSIEVAGSGSPLLRTTYEPVLARVTRGDEVVAGQVVAVLGPGPFHCAAGCLHWGLRRADAYLDPLSLLPPSLLRRGPSRLLPVFGVPHPRPGPAGDVPDRAGTDRTLGGSARTAGQSGPAAALAVALTVAAAAAAARRRADRAGTGVGRGGAGLRISRVRRAGSSRRPYRRRRRALPRLPARSCAPPRPPSPAAASPPASAAGGRDRPAIRRSW